MATISVLLSQIDQVSAGDVVYPPGGRLGPRWQRDVQLVLVHAGSVQITVDGGLRATLAVGAVGLLLPGHRERFAFADDVPTRHSWLQARVADAPIQRLAALPPALPVSTSLAELMREAAAVARTPLSTAEPLLAALAAAAIWRYAGEADSRARAPSEPVDRARRFLHEQLGEAGIGLEQVARAAHVSPAHLVRRFKAELGVTPMAYLWERRVATGIDLLTHTGLPVGQVAARTGFKSVYHFSRRVKSHAGIAPTELRRRHWISPRKG
jgi:AraC-like DNA-binding protein